MESIAEGDIVLPLLFLLAIAAGGFLIWKFWPQLMRHLGLSARLISCTNCGNQWSVNEEFGQRVTCQLCGYVFNERKEVLRRYWQDASGKPIVDAYFVEVKERVVMLERAKDGAIVTLDINSLSVDDQRALSALMLQKQKNNAAPVRPT